LAAAALLASSLTCLPATASPVMDPAAVLSARERAAGNREASAVRLGSALLATRWPAQVLKIRVDGVGRREVAGLVLSGVKFHRPLGADDFTGEVVALVERAFAASDVEEVDVWATVPLTQPQGAAESGDELPVTRIVYAVTVPREEQGAFAVRLRRGGDVFWDPAWRRSLRQGSTPSKAQS